MAKWKHELFTRDCKDLLRYIKDGLLSDLCNTLQKLLIRTRTVFTEAEPIVCLEIQPNNY